MKKKTNKETKQIEVVNKLYKITNKDRLLLRLSEKGLDDTYLEKAEINHLDIRTKRLKNLKSKDSIFRNVCLQGCYMKDVDFNSNTFVNCDFRWATLPLGFHEKNTFVNCLF